MARGPLPTPEVEKLDEARIAEIAADLELDPPFVERLAKAEDHGDYLEHAHESTIRALAVIHMRLSRGEIESATELVAKLRAHLDTLWEQRKEAAERLVAP